jgi:hypothetical protein
MCDQICRLKQQMPLKTLEVTHNSLWCPPIADQKPTKTQLSSNVSFLKREKNHINQAY